MSDVIIYTTSTCTYCKAAKRFFNEHNVKYEEHNVGEDQNAAKEMVEKSGQMGVPVIMVDNEIVVGFDQPRLMELLNIS